MWWKWFQHYHLSGVEVFNLSQIIFDLLSLQLLFLRKDPVRLSLGLK